MRRIVLLITATALTVLVASGVALGATRIGTDGPDVLRGPTEQTTSWARADKTPSSPCVVTTTSMALRARTGSSVATNAAP
jgi:hypothetical protein